MLDATSRDADKSEVVSVLDALNATVGDVSQDSSPAALIGKLDSALSSWRRLRNQLPELNLPFLPQKIWLWH